MQLLRSRLLLIGGLLCLELVLLAVAYQLLVAFECQATGAETGCRLLRSLVVRALALFAAFGLFAWARPQALAGLMRRTEVGGGAPWLLLHVAGVALLLVPLPLVAGRDSDALFDVAVAPWILGSLAAAVGALFWLARPRDWLAWLREERFAPLAVAAVALVIPDVADLALPVWGWPVLTRLTFHVVDAALRVAGAEALSDPGSFVIGMDGFHVRIAQQCSGVEGFALVTGFILLYAALFRDQLRFPLFWLVVLPVGLALSWALNVLRIATLIWIGARVSPDLAVNGFHSYAGWMFFTLLAMALLYGVQAVPWLHARSAPPARQPLLEDWTAACILPFVAFMLASVVASALSPQPDLAYPLKALAMAAVLAAFHRAYRRLDWAVDGAAVAAGGIVGLAWIAMQPPPGADDAALTGALAGLGVVALAAWAVVRLLGTVLLVPLVEELFFRGYVLVRLDRGGLAWRLVAIAVSSALFAALHGRWAAAGLAGVVFALVMLRRGRVTDAVAAHVTANLVVAIWALARGDWSAL